MWHGKNGENAMEYLFCLQESHSLLFSHCFLAQSWVVLVSDAYVPKPISGTACFVWNSSSYAWQTCVETGFSYQHVLGFGGQQCKVECQHSIQIRYAQLFGATVKGIFTWSKNHRELKLFGALVTKVWFWGAGRTGGCWRLKVKQKSAGWITLLQSRDVHIFELREMMLLQKQPSPSKSLLWPLHADWIHCLCRPDHRGLRLCDVVQFQSLAARQRSRNVGGGNSMNSGGMKVHETSAVRNWNVLIDMPFWEGCTTMNWYDAHILVQ